MLCGQEAQNNQQETSYLEAAKGSGVTMEKRDTEYFFKFTLEASNCQLDLLTVLSPKSTPGYCSSSVQRLCWKYLETNQKQNGDEALFAG